MRIRLLAFPVAAVCLLLGVSACGDDDSYSSDATAVEQINAICEDWRQALVRELREETGIEAASRDVRLVDAMSSPDGHLLLFGALPERPADQLPQSAATDETAGWHLLRRPDELAFPLHTVAARAWFEGRD